MNTSKEGAIGKEILEGEIFQQRLFIQLRFTCRMRQHGFDFRAKQEKMPQVRVIKRLDAKTITGEK